MKTTTIQAVDCGRALLPPYVKVDVFADGDACLTTRDCDGDLALITLRPETRRAIAAALLEGLD